MLSGTDAVRNREKIWRLPPWTEKAAPWQELDRTLPADHLARRIRTLVLSLDLDELRRSYLGVGKRAFPPELMVMVVLYELHRGQLHPVRWAQDCKFADPVKWLAMGLQPSASYFYAFRQRLVRYVQCWNQQLLRRALADGATEANQGAVDGTFVAALGSRHRLLQAKTLAERCQGLRQALAADARAARGEAAAHALPSGTAAAGAERCLAARRWPYWMAKTVRGRGRQLFGYQQAQERLDVLLAQHAQRENRKAKRKRRRADQVRICPREPEAALGRDKLKTFRPLYDVQLVSDVTTPLIFDYGVYATNTDAGLLIPTLQKVEQPLGRPLAKVLVDGLYATAANLGYCDEHGVTLYAPVADRVAGERPRAASAKAKQLGKEHFRWHAAEETYYCPEGHRLLQIGCKVERREQDQQVRVYQYRCPPQHCQACHRAAECTQAPHKGRTIKRSEHEEKVERLRQRMQTPEAQALYKKRSQSVEPRFGNLKSLRGLLCFAGFGVALAMVQVGLLVLVHNGLYLLARSAVTANGAPPASAHDGSCPSGANAFPAVHNTEALQPRRSRPHAPT
jgi:hypothetical protein